MKGLKKFLMKTFCSRQIENQLAKLQIDLEKAEASYETSQSWDIGPAYCPEPSYVQERLLKKIGSIESEIEKLKTILSWSIVLDPPVMAGSKIVYFYKYILGFILGEIMEPLVSLSLGKFIEDDLISYLLKTPEIHEKVKNDLKNGPNEVKFFILNGILESNLSGEILNTFKPIILEILDSNDSELITLSIDCVGILLDHELLDFEHIKSKLENLLNHEDLQVVHAAIDMCNVAILKDNHHIIDTILEVVLKNNNEYGIVVSGLDKVLYTPGYTVDKIDIYNKLLETNSPEVSDFVRYKLKDLSKYNCERIVLKLIDNLESSNVYLKINTIKLLRQLNRKEIIEQCLNDENQHVINEAKDAIDSLNFDSKYNK